MPERSKATESEAHPDTPALEVGKDVGERPPVHLATLADHLLDVAQAVLAEEDLVADEERR
jgi:hypothetical protein